MGFWSSIVAIAGVVAAPFTGGLSLIATAAAVVAPKVVDKVVDFVMKPFMKAFGVPDTPDIGAEANKQEGYLVTRQGGNEALPVIYGFRATGGTVVYAETGPLEGTPKNKYLWVAYALCEGPVEGLKTLSLDDRDFPETMVARLNAGETVDVSGIDASIPSFKYNGVTKLRFYNGVYYSNPASSPVGTDVKAGIFKDAPNFTPDMVFNGVAVLFARYEIIERTTQEQADNNPFSGSVPTVLAGIMGRKVQALGTARYTNGVYDASATASMVSNINTWWTATSNSESNGASAYDPNGGRYSTNPVECLFDYLRNPRYGKGLSVNDIDKDTWIAAANKCNQYVTYYTGARGPIMTCNYIVDTGQTLFNNVKTILAGFRGYMPYVQGKYKVKVEDAGNEYDILSGSASIVATLVAGNRMSAGYDDNVYDIVGDVTYTGIERTSKYNQVVVSYVDPDQKWSSQQAVWPPTETERQVYIAEDGYRENKGEFTMYTITNSIMALDMARLIFNKSRYQETCTTSVSAEGFELEPGDNVRIQSNVLNFGDIPWRIISTTLNANYTFEISCVRNPDTIYPYGRYNEPDVVRGVYIPRQNEIYLPSQSNPLMGIFPPSYAPMPSNWTGNVPPGNTAPTVPTNPGSGTTPGGGGVGGGGGSISGGTPVTNPPAPKPPVVVATTDDVIAMNNAVLNGNTWTVSFTKPPATNYAGVKVWWKPQYSGGNFYAELPEISSGATSFSFTNDRPTLGVNLITRVKYSNGDYSTRVANGYCNPLLVSGQNPANGTYNFADIGNPIVGSFPAYDLRAPLKLVYGRNSSTITNPKSMEFSICEPVNTAGGLNNGILGSIGIKAIHIWFRRNPIVGTDTGWTKKIISVSNTKAYEEFTFSINSLFGSDDSISYDFVAQWQFIDGSMGNQQLTFNVPTSSTPLVGVTNVFTNRNAIAMTEKASSSLTNSTASIQVLSIERATTSPPGSSGTVIADGIRLTFTSPTYQGKPDWAGIKVEIAPVKIGTTISYTKFEKINGLTAIPGTSSSQYYYDIQTGFADIAKTGLKYNIIVTMLYYDAGVLKESTYSRKYSGTFSSSIVGDQRTTMVEEASSPTFTTVLKGDAGSLPVVASTKQIIKPNYVGIYGIKNFLTLTDTEYAAQTIKVKSFRIKFTIPTQDAAGNPITFNKVRVYRRYHYYSTDAVTGWGVKSEWETDSNTGVMEYTDITSSDINLAGNSAGIVLRWNRYDDSNGYGSPILAQNKVPQIFVRLYTGSGAGTASDCVIIVPLRAYTVGNTTGGTSYAQIADNTWWDKAWTSADYVETSNLIDLSNPAYSSWLKPAFDAADLAGVDTKDGPIIYWEHGYAGNIHTGVIR